MPEDRSQRPDPLLRDPRERRAAPLRDGASRQTCSPGPSRYRRSRRATRRSCSTTATSGDPRWRMARTRSPRWRVTCLRSPTPSGSTTFHLLGVSMGGAIAQEMAIPAPERLRTLTPGGHVRRRRRLRAQPERRLGGAREADQPRAAHRRADAAEPLRGVLRERGGRGVHARDDPPEPVPAVRRRRSRASSTRRAATTPARGSRRCHAHARDRARARHPGAGLEGARSWPG